MSGNVPATVSIYGAFHTFGQAVVYQWLPALATGLFFFFLQWLLTNLVEAALRKLGVSRHYARSYAEVIRMLTIAAGIFYFLVALGFNPTEVLLPLGVVSLSLGYAAGPILSNYFTGITCYLFSQLHVGVAYEIAGVKGILVDIGRLQLVLVVNNIGRVVYIPNTTVLTSSVAVLSEQERNAINAVNASHSHQIKEEEPVFEQNKYTPWNINKINEA